VSRSLRSADSRGLRVLPSGYGRYNSRLQPTEIAPFGSEGTLWLGVGAMLGGWGLFNFLEGLIDHHILGIHHVVERLHLSVYDYAFLASGVLLMIIGGLLIRTARLTPRP